MQRLRSYLGNHQGFRRGQLTEREAAMLVICAGRRSGFVVRTEIQVLFDWPSKQPSRPEIDIGWYSPRTNKLLAVWEIDGQDAERNHILGCSEKRKVGNKAKFITAAAPISVQVLYSLKNKIASKRTSKRSLIQDWLGEEIAVVSDEELMANNGIERWMTSASEKMSELGD